MVGMKEWAKKKFGKNPLDIPKQDVKRDIMKINRRAAVIRDEIDDSGNQIRELMRKSVGKSKEEKVAMANEIRSLKIKKQATQKKHQKLMADVSALYALDGVISLKDSMQSEVLENVMKKDISDVMRVAEEAGIKLDLETDTSKELVEALAGSWGYDEVGDKETEEILAAMDEYEAGSIDEDIAVDKVEESKGKRKLVE
ncbi:MAG: hypothetical protein V3W19_09145 [Desulfatiglandales bacterium]